MVNNSNKLPSDPDDSVEADSLVGGDVPCLDEQDTPHQTMYSRRDFLKIGTVVGGGFVIAATTFRIPGLAEADGNGGFYEWATASIRNGNTVTSPRYIEWAREVGKNRCEIQDGLNAMGTAYRYRSSQVVHSATGVEIGQGELHLSAYYGFGTVVFDLNEKGEVTRNFSPAIFDKAHMKNELSQSASIYGLHVYHIDPQTLGGIVYIAEPVSTGRGDSAQLWTSIDGHNWRYNSQIEASKISFLL